ncbi:MAG: TetR/AcrR family transcriptional regulator [Hyphomicrobiales bacterium]
MTTPTRKAEQSERTKAALVAAGRELFAQRGYAGVSAEEIAAAADVTTGAVYHHYGSKAALFRAVFESLEQELTAELGEAAAKVPDPWSQFQAAALAFLDAATRPDIRQVVLIDARSVLGWDTWYGIMAQYGLGMTRAAVTGLIEGGWLPKLPADALATVLFGALNEAALAIATSEDPATTRGEAVEALGHVLARLALRQP